MLGAAVCGAGGAFLLFWAKAKDETINKTRMADGFPRAFLLLSFDLWRLRALFAAWAL